jgi:hypothetical protein
MLIPLTDPNHELARLMIDQIDRSQRRAAHHPEAPHQPAAPRRRQGWHRLATLQKDANGRRSIRIFRAPAPAI